MNKILFTLILLFTMLKLFAGILTTATGTATSIDFIDDRFRNNAALASDGKFYTTTFGLENFNPETTQEMPVAKHGRLIKFGIQNSDTQWNLTNLQIVDMKENLWDESQHQISSNAYESGDLSSLYNDPNYHATADYRYDGGTGCWASPVILKGNTLSGCIIVLNKSGMLLCVNPNFVTIDTNNNAKATVIWQKNLRNIERNFLSNSYKYEYMSTPCQCEEYLYVAGISRIFKIQVSDGEIVNSAGFQLSDDYIINPITFDNMDSHSFYTGSLNGKIIAFDEGLNITSSLAGVNHLLTPPIVDADGHIYLAGGSNISNGNPNLISFDQKNKPYLGTISNLQSYNPGNSINGEICNRNSAFTSSILTDKSKNLYLFDDNYVHYYAEKYDLANAANVDPMKYQGYGDPMRVREIGSYYKMFGNNSALYERSDSSRTLIYTVNNSSNNGYYTQSDPYYPETIEEADLTNCTMVGTFVGFHHILLNSTGEPPEPSRSEGFSLLHRQAWGGITPYLANNTYYNGIVGDERGGITSYTLAFGTRIFPDRVNPENPQPLIPETGISKYMKGNENVITYSTLPPITIYFVDTGDANHIVSTDELSQVFLNSYVRSTEYSSDAYFQNGLKVVFEGLLPNQDYSLSYAYTHDNNTLYGEFNNIHIDSNHTIFVFDVRITGLTEFDVEENAIRSLDYHGSLPLVYPIPIICREGSTLNEHGYIQAEKMIMYEGSHLNIEDGIYPFEVNYLDCYAHADCHTTDLVYRPIEFGLNHSTLNPNPNDYTGRLKVMTKMSIYDDADFPAGFKLPIIFKSYGRYPVTGCYSFWMNALLNENHCSLEFRNLNISTLLCTVTSKVDYLLNLGTLLINDNVKCGRFWQGCNDDTKLEIGNSADLVVRNNQSRFEIDRCNSPLAGCIKVGYDGIPNNRAVLEFNNCGSTNYSGINGYTQCFEVWGTLKLTNQNSLNIDSGRALAIYPKAVVELNGGDNPNANGSELVAINNSRIRFAYNDSFIHANQPNVVQDSIYISGYKPATGTYYGDRIRTDETGAIYSFFINDWSDYYSYYNLSIKSSNPIPLNRWEGIIINNTTTSDINSNVINCTISGISKFSIDNHSNIRIDHCKIYNCQNGVYFTTNLYYPATQRLIVENSTFNECSYGIYVYDTSEDEVPNSLKASITGCNFGIRNNNQSRNGFGINMFGCCEAVIKDCDFNVNGYGIFALDSSIEVGNNYTTDNIPNDQSTDADRCHFYTNSKAGIYIAQSNFSQSLVYNNDFINEHNDVEPGIGIWAEDALVDVMKNTIAQLPGHGFMGRLVSRRNTDAYHGFSGNLFQDNSGCELIGDGVSLSNLYIDRTMYDGNTLPNTIRDDSDNSYYQGQVNDPLDKMREWDHYIMGNITEDKIASQSVYLADVRNNIIIPNWVQIMDRFYPNVSAYVFNPREVSPFTTLLSESICRFYEGDFETSRNMFKQIVGEYPDSLQTKLAIEYWYMLERCTEKDFLTLREYLDSKIHSENLAIYKKKEEIKTKCYIQEEDYLTAIQRLQLVIDNPETLADSIFAAIDQGYCYMMLATKGEKSLPNCQIKTPTYESYSTFMQNIGGSLHTENDTPGIGANLKLMPNYPNPFNPETTIRFYTPVKGDIKLHIYNVKGQIVKTLINSNLSKGQHKIVWDGRDDNNKTVSSGVYFMHLEQSGKVQTGKMLLLK